MERRAYHDRKTGRSTYWRPIRNSDIVPKAKILENSGSPAYGQRLAAKSGTAAAGRLLYGTKTL